MYSLLEPPTDLRNESSVSGNLQLNTNGAGSSSNDEFKKELMLKREARQRAIAAISSEMDRLKRELEAEKVAHSETAKLLDGLKEAQALSTAESKTDGNDNSETKTDDKKTSERIEALRLSDLLRVRFFIILIILLWLEIFYAEAFLQLFSDVLPEFFFGNS